MPPLQRAVALAEVNHIAVPIAEHLDFDMPGVADEMLQIERFIAECGSRLCRRSHECGLHLGTVCNDLHAAPAAARRGLHHDRKADTIDCLDGLVERRHLFGAGEDGDAVLPREAARRKLVAHLVNVIGSRAHEGDTVSGA